MRTLLSNITLMICIGTLVSCGSSKPDESAPLVDQTPPQPEPTIQIPDEGPVLTRFTDSIASTEAPERNIVASRKFADTKNGYVVVNLPARVFHQWTRVQDATAFVAGSGSGDAIVRFTGTIPQTFTLHAWAGVRDQPYGAMAKKPGSEHLTILVDTKSAQTDAKLPTEFRQKAADFFRDRSISTDEPFFTFASNRLRLMSGDPNQANRRETDIGELMNLYTGYTSVQETLQHDRALLIRRDSGKQDVKLADIQGVPLEEHPWDAMIKELGAAPKVEPMAGAIPADMLYVHMHDLRDFVKIAGELDGWVTPVAQALEGHPGPRHFTDRYESQLVVARTGLAESLGHVASDGIALTMSDPFLREGTDISLVFRVKNRAALVAALQGFEASLRAERQDVTVGEIEVKGVKVRVLSTPDGHARQHRAELGDLMILSNSPAAIAKFVDVSTKAAPSLAQSKDFQYMRTLYPFDPAQETGFVFVSDAFVAHAVSPKVKIAESRRMEIQADLYAVNYAALLFGFVEGRQPKNVDELVKAGYLNATELKHADGAPIAFSPATAASSKYGTVSFLKPIGEWQLDKVSAAERDAYNRFRETYQSYWKRYIDPIAMRIKRSEDGKKLEAEVRILPLIEETEYDELLSLVGQQRIKPPKLDSGVYWAFGVGANARLRREMDQMATMFTGNNKISIGWLGDWIMVGAADRSGLWDAGLVAGAIPENAYRETRWSADDENFSKVVQRLPFFAAADVSNQIMLAGVLTALRSFVDQAAPNMIEWSQSEVYRDMSVVTIREKNPQAEDAFGLQIHYTIVNSVWLVALDQATLYQQIDAILDGKMPTSVEGTSPTPSPDDLQSSIGLRFSNADGLSWLAKTLLGMAEREVQVNAEMAASSYWALTRGLARNLAQDDVRRLGLAYLGYEPRDAHGGSFKVDGFGVVTNSFYGGVLEQRLPDVPVKPSLLSDTISRIEALQFALGFSGDAPHRGLFGRMTWDWK